MERMWTFLRPRVASTFEQLQQQLRLEELSEQFDGLIFKTSMPLNRLAEVRTSFSTALKAFDAFNNPGNGLLMDLQQSLLSLEALSESNMREICPHFGSSFELATQRLVIGPSRGYQSFIARLEILASRPTTRAFAIEDPGSGQNLFQCIPVPAHHDNVSLADDDLHTRLLQSM